MQNDVSKSICHLYQSHGKGQITIPKEIHDVLSVLCGDQVAFVAAGNTIRMVNSAVYAMQMFQREMAGEAARIGLTSEDDVMGLVRELRNGG